MPEAYAYAFAVTMSGRNDIPHDVVQSAKAWFAKCEYHAVVLEHDVNGRLHLHAGVLFKTGKKPSNVKACLRYPKAIREWEAQNNSRHCIQVKKMSSEQWLTTYMQKDGPMELCNFPDDLEDIAYAFASEKEQKKAINPEFARWARMYHDQEWQLPADERSCYEFFHHNMFVLDTLKIMTDQKRLRDRTMALVQYINRSEAREMYLGMQRSAEEVSMERQVKFNDRQIRELENLGIS